MRSTLATMAPMTQTGIAIMGEGVSNSNEKGAGISDAEAELRHDPHVIRVKCLPPTLPIRLDEWRVAERL